MFLSRWFRRRRQTQRIALLRSFRPGVQVLENRTVPSSFGCSGGGGEDLATAGPATHLQVIAPESATAGKSFDIVIEADDASNNVASGYTGTVHLSLSPTDSGATLPADYTFTARDHGVHRFHVTLSGKGSETVSATDTTTASITGSAMVNSGSTAATQLSTRVAEQGVVGSPISVTVTALDASGHVASGYAGTVKLTSSDPNATLPASYTFTAADHGKHTFKVTFAAAGTQTVTASDSANSLAASASLSVDAVGTVTHFAIFTLGSATKGVATQVVVVALDAANHVVSGYTGTIHFTSSDGSATLPADYSFVASDNGMHVFSVTFATKGDQTLTLADTSNSSITSSRKVKVRP